MSMEKGFKKQELKSKDYKGMEQGAKVLKKGTIALATATVIFKKRKNLAALGKGVLTVAKKIVLK